MGIMHLSVDDSGMVVDGLVIEDSVFRIAGGVQVSF